MKATVLIFLSLILMASCSMNKKTDRQPANSIRLITLDPGHFHASLVQKSMYSQIDSVVHVYAPAGEDVNEHLKRVEGYNSRTLDPTHWCEIVYTGPDYLQKMLAEKAGNVVVLAGNNQKKTQYIKASVEAGLNVLADKPMAIDPENFNMLRESFDIARQKGVLIYDIMTERSEITTILQREFSMDQDIFGTLETGTPDDPAVTKESVHHFFKFVSGTALRRPAWFFDVRQQGEGIVDVTTHLVDLIQWECFPEQAIDYTKDIEIINARRWPTAIYPSGFREITGVQPYPDYLKKDVKDSVLNVYSNGEINYRIRGIYARVSVTWNYKAPEGTGDTHFSVMRGTKANLIIRQGKEQNYKPTLYIEPVDKENGKLFAVVLASGIEKIQGKYPGIQVKNVGQSWEVIIPDKYRIGHEEHFAQVMERFLQYLKAGKLPEWEEPNMLAKYYITTKALELATEQK